MVMFSSNKKRDHQENMSVNCIPHKPHVYIVKLGYAGVCLFSFLIIFSFKTYIVGTRRGGSNVYP